MFLLEKSLIGVYCNRLYDLRERHGSFLCYDRIIAKAPAKILMSQILI